MNVESKRVLTKDIILSSYIGYNDLVFKKILRLFVFKGSRICDPCYGKRVFWRKVKNSDCELYHSDLATDGVDCRSTPYRGISPLILSLHQDRFGFESKYYATFDQWRKLGGVVQKRPSDVKPGEWGATIIYYNMLSKFEEDAITGIEIERKIPILRTFTVFFIDQVEGDHLDNFRADKEIVVEHDFIDYQSAENFTARLDAKILHGGSQAFYRPSTDEIHVPRKESFDTVEDYYSTLFHEISHWTEKRCNGSGSYAEGELRAEIAGCFLMSELGVPQSNNMDNHFAYLENWLQSLKNDPKYIFRATAAASNRGVRKYTFPN